MVLYYNSVRTLRQVLNGRHALRDIVVNSRWEVHFSLTISSVVYQKTQGVLQCREPAANLRYKIPTTEGGGF